MWMPSSWPCCETCPGLRKRAVQAKSVEFRHPLIAYVDRVNELLNKFQSVSTPYLLVTPDYGSTSEQSITGTKIGEENDDES